MIKLRDRVRIDMEKSEAVTAVNELMGVEASDEGKNFRTMKECLRAMLGHAGVSCADVYGAKKSRFGKKVCYVFSFLSCGRRYTGWIDARTMEVLRFSFQAA